MAALPARQTYLDGEDLRPRLLTERKERLRTLLANAAPCLHYSDHVIAQGPAFYDKGCAMHVEGIVSKRIDAPYTPGNRGLWRKVKCLNRAEFVVVGWTDPPALILCSVKNSKLGFAEPLLKLYLVARHRSNPQKPPYVPVLYIDNASPDGCAGRVPIIPELVESIEAWEKLWGPVGAPSPAEEYPPTWKTWEREILTSFLTQDPDTCHPASFEHDATRARALSERRPARYRLSSRHDTPNDHHNRVPS